MYDRYCSQNPACLRSPPPPPASRTALVCFRFFLLSQVMIASTVSSKMLSAVARLEGFTFEETLPGFKWMGHRGQQLKVRCRWKKDLYMHQLSVACRRLISGFITAGISVVLSTFQRDHYYFSLFFVCRRVHGW